MTLANIVEKCTIIPVSMRYYHVRVFLQETSSGIYFFIAEL